jgi:hypothetical protein
MDIKKTQQKSLSKYKLLLHDIRLWTLCAHVKYVDRLVTRRLSKLRGHEYEPWSCVNSAIFPYSYVNAFSRSSDH